MSARVLGLFVLQRGMVNWYVLSEKHAISDTTGPRAMEGREAVVQWSVWCGDELRSQLAPVPAGEGLYVNSGKKGTEQGRV